MKRFHIALSVANINKSIQEYTQYLDQQPQIIIPEEYALWRTETLNFSIRKDKTHPPGTLRHLGFENPEAQKFQTSTDCNGILWEEFTKQQQEDEIKETWPSEFEKS